MPFLFQYFFQGFLSSEIIQQVPMCVVVIANIKSFDNIEASIFCCPKLTTISQNIPKKAEHAFELLMKQINNEPVSEKKEVLDLEIIERQSAIPRVGN